MKTQYGLRARILLISLLLVSSSCMQSDWENSSTAEVDNVHLELPFLLTQAEVQTRAHSVQDLENRLDDLYLLLFNSEGQKVESYYFTAEQLNLERSQTQGKISLELAAPSKLRLFALANLSSSAYELNRAELEQIKSWEELSDIHIRLKEQTGSRKDSFLMTATFEDAQGKEQYLDTQDLQALHSGQYALRLRRLDAKVQVHIHTAEGVSFQAESWQVCRLAATAQALASTSPSTQQDFFDLAPQAFEQTDNSFSFYLLENKQTPAQWIDLSNKEEAYQAREKQHKHPLPQPNPLKPGHTTHNGAFAYAPPNGTYIVLKGELRYTKESGEEVLAQVRYRVHLGYANQDPNDYAVHRNTDYHYHLTLASAESIFVEVKESKELQPGASGHITQYAHVIHTDAHYDTHLLSFHYDDIEFLTWKVKTPFLEGYREDLFAYPHEGDSNWVLFLVNEQVPDPYLGGYSYTPYLRPFPGEAHRLANHATVEEIKLNARSYQPQLMTATQLVHLLGAYKKEQMERPDLYDHFGNQKTIHLTAFIQEFYYSEHPLTNKQEEDLWKRFVNVPDRKLTFLNTRRFSSDGESSLSQALVSISQKSIQILPGLASTSVWGVESIDETGALPFEVGAASNQGKHKYSSSTDGHANTLEFLKDVEQGKFWTTYLLPYSNQLQAAYRAAKYACLLRNRDNNGDGKIDQDELRWYLPAIEQLQAWAEQSSALAANYYASSTIAEKNTNTGHTDPYLLFAAPMGTSTHRLSSIRPQLTAGKLHYRCLRNLKTP